MRKTKKTAKFNYRFIFYTN